MEEFMLPDELGYDDLSDISGRFRILTDDAVEYSSAGSLAAAADHNLNSLCEHEPLSIANQSDFHELYGIVRQFTAIAVMPRARIFDALCTNLSVLTASIASMLIGGCGDSQGSLQTEELVTKHRSALKAYVFFLHWAAVQCENEDAAMPTESGIPVTARRSKKAGEQDDLQTWNWKTLRVRVARTLWTMSDVQLGPLFAPHPVDQQLLHLLLRFGILLLDQRDPSVLRESNIKEATARMFATLALRHGLLEEVAYALFGVLRDAKHEHISCTIADIAAHTSCHEGDDRLAVELLQQVTAVPPAEYERMMTNTSASVRTSASFISDLAERLPKVVAAHSALLVAHLGSKAYPIRSAVVHAMASLVAEGFSAPHDGECTETATQSRLRAKQQLLELLLERARDKAAHTRAATCRAWEYLAQPAESGCSRIPISHWLPVTQMAVGRLEDNGASVRKAAIRLLKQLLERNPFGSGLRADRFQATLEAESARLNAMLSETKGHNGKPHISDEMAHCTSNIKQDPEPEDIIVGGHCSELEIQRGRVASLETACAFATALSASLPLLTQLLASSTVTDVQEAVGMLVRCVHFDIQGSAAAARHMLPLAFHREQGVRDTVIDAIRELYISDFPTDQAANLAALAKTATLGEMASLDAVIQQLMQKDLISDETIEELWRLAASTQSWTASSEETHASDAQAAMSVVALVAGTCPMTVLNNLDMLLKIGFGPTVTDGMMTRQACIALRCLAQLPANSRSTAQTDQLTYALTAAILHPRCHPADWYGTAEAAVATLYALHPTPSELLAAIVDALAKAALGSTGISDDETLPITGSAESLSRLFFCIGHVALQHLVFVERCARAASRTSSDERPTKEVDQDADAANSGGDMGMGADAAADDLAVEHLKDLADSQICASHTALGRFVPLIVSFCQNSKLMAAHRQLRASALLALTKLMTVDATLCENNLNVLFTLLESGTAAEPSVRSNLVIAMGDLALRFPNHLERWTPHMYRPLSDLDPGVRKNTLMVLTHLILNDMLKVKGHIAKLALCLQDSDPHIASLAHLFFDEMSRKTNKNGNPIYNLLPDILSALGAEANLPDSNFQAIMATLLSYVDSKRHTEQFADRLAQRLGNVAQEPIAACNIAYCFTQLQLTDKAIRRLNDSWRTYQTALDHSVALAHFQALVDKARKSDKRGDLQECLDDFEAKLLKKAEQIDEAKPKTVAEDPSASLDSSVGIEAHMAALSMADATLASVDQYPTASA